MRLKNSNYPTIREDCASRLQGGLNCRWMMSVVIDPVNSVHLAAMFEPTLHTGKLGNSTNRSFDGHTAFHRSSDRGYSILAIVNARDLQMNQTEIRCLVSNQKCLLRAAR